MQRTRAKIYKIEGVVGQDRLEKICGRHDCKGDNSYTMITPNSTWIRNGTNKRVHWTDYKAIGDSLWRMVISRPSSYNEVSVSLVNKYKEDTD